MYNLWRGSGLTVGSTSKITIFLKVCKFMIQPKETQFFLFPTIVLLTKYFHFGRSLGVCFQIKLFYLTTFIEYLVLTGIYYLVLVTY